MLLERWPRGRPFPRSASAQSPLLLACAAAEHAGRAGKATAEELRQMAAQLLDAGDPDMVDQVR